jgi:hypothetical protein
VTGIPFVTVGGKLDLTNGLIDAKALAATIKGLEERLGYPCVLIILDTVLAPLARVTNISRNTCRCISIQRQRFTAPPLRTLH